MTHALGKPAHVFGRDREWQALADFAADPRPEATLGIVSGRRRHQLPAFRADELLTGAGHRAPEGALSRAPGGPACRGGRGPRP